MFPDACVRRLPCIASDHNPLVLESNESLRPSDLKRLVGASRSSNQRSGRSGIVESDGTPLFRISKKLKLLKQALRVWNKEIFGDIRNRKAAQEGRIA
jgi:hypothetical protein